MLPAATIFDQNTRVRNFESKAHTLLGENLLTWFTMAFPLIALVQLIRFDEERRIGRALKSEPTYSFRQESVALRFFVNLHLNK